MLQFPLACGLFLFYLARACMVGPYADSSKLSYTTSQAWYKLRDHSRVPVHPLLSGKKSVHQGNQPLTFFFYPACAFKLGPMPTAPSCPTQLSAVVPLSPLLYSTIESKDNKKQKKIKQSNVKLDGERPDTE